MENSGNLVCLERTTLRQSKHQGCLESHRFERQLKNFRIAVAGNGNLSQE